MDIRTDRVYERGVGEENEDALVAVDGVGLYAVIDGATALGEGGASGGVAARAVRDTLEANAESGDPLLEIVRRANEELRRAAFGDGEIPVLKEARSSSGVAAIRISPADDPLPRRLEYLQAGDCMIFVEYGDDHVRPLTRDQIAHLDAVAIGRARSELHRWLGGTDPTDVPTAELVEHFEAARASVLSLLVENRRRLNTPEGYGVLDGSPEAVRYLETGSVPLVRACRILLMTDGLQLPDADPEDDGWLETARFAFRNGLEVLLERVRELEESDPACYRFPRLKQADDKTGILVTLG